MQTPALTIVTCSYGPDAQRCRRLCTSIDRFVPAKTEHVIIVPRRDYPLFGDLHRGRRRVLITEEVVPGSFMRMPLTLKVWLGPQGRPVRGWIMQQITKLSANHAVDTELMMFADSDLQLIRPFDPKVLFRDERLRLHRLPGAMNSGRHLLWHHRAAQLLGEESRYFGGDYVGQMITWRRSNLDSLQSHLESVHGAPWFQPIAQSKHFSEYILYGAYVEHVVGKTRNGHFHCADDICHCCWVPADVRQLEDGSAILSGNAQALLLQSNLGLSQEQENALRTKAMHGFTRTTLNRNLTT